MSAKPASSSPTDENQSFLELSRRLKAYHDSWGIPLKTYEDESLPYFSKMSVAEKKQILASLETSLSLYDEMTAKKENPTDSARYLWRTLQRLGWRMLSDILDKIEIGDVVEIYSSKDIQVFRNLNFFRYISLTLEEMCCFAWYQVAEMEKHAAEYYITMGPKMLNNQIPETFRNPLAPYKVQELRGERGLMQIEPRWLSPVFEGKQCVGVISIIRCQMLHPAEDED